jgi:hypothetical protein
MKSIRIRAIYDLDRNASPNFLNRQFLYYRQMPPFGFGRKGEQPQPFTTDITDKENSEEICKACHTLNQNVTSARNYIRVGKHITIS